MKSLPVRLLLAAMCVAGMAAPTFAQEQEQQKQQQAPPRQAQPRRAAPRSAPPPARQTAPPPARQAAPPRAESPRAEAPRAAERSRGTDGSGRVRVPPATAGTASRTDRERPRDDSPARGVSRQRAVPRTEAPAATAPPAATAGAAPQGERTTRSRRDPANASSDDAQEQRRAVPRGSRPRGDNRATGRAVPRDTRRDPIYDGGWRGRSSSRNYYYYYYPRRYYPYGYGAFGLGYFYYDPYRWYGYDPYYSPYYRHSPYYRGQYYGSDYDYYTGELRLQVRPRHAEVYVDGYFAGHVDDFDGIFQSLRLEEGPYRIEIVAPGYEPLEIDIRIQPGRKITYRGELRPRP